MGVSTGRRPSRLAGFRLTRGIDEAREQARRGTSGRPAVGGFAQLAWLVEPTRLYTFARSCEPHPLVAAMAAAVPSASMWLETFGGAGGDEHEVQSAAGAAEGSVAGAAETATTLVSDKVMDWLVTTRPYLKVQLRTLPENGRGLPLDAVLAEADHGANILHQMIDALRAEAGGRFRGALTGFDPQHAVPWRRILALPHVGTLANRQIPDGPAKGKTALCLLSNQAMPGRDYQDACHSICTWLLENEADPDLASSPDKCPLMLSAGSGNADIFNLLLEARASIGTAAGPTADAVLRSSTKARPDIIL